MRFEYSYDQFNQLATSVFGTYTNSTNGFTQRSEYSETGAGNGNISYDRNGNISRLLRIAYTNSLSTLMTLDNLTYTIGTNSNRLESILDASANPFAASFNFKTTSTTTPVSFGYNSIGQMTASPAEDVSAIDYFPDGKIKMITYNSTGNTTEYTYGPDGQKLKCKYHIVSSNKNKYIWYVDPYRYEYDETAATPGFTIAEVQVPTGVLRVNGTSVSSGYLIYEVNDHLGNVRATYKATGTGSGIDILTFADYYAFGGQLPGRRLTPADYHYGYQGQEKNDETNPWQQFELRMYNQDLGRWFAPDPYGQFDSPYLAMANDPEDNIDPDGGWLWGYWLRGLLFGEIEDEGWGFSWSSGGTSGSSSFVSTNIDSGPGSGQGAPPPMNPQSSGGGDRDDGTGYIDPNPSLFGNRFTPWRFPFQTEKQIKDLEATAQNQVTIDRGPEFTKNSYSKNETGDLAGITTTEDRNYGGDGSGSALDNTYKVADFLNQFNPIASLLDLISNAFTGKDRFGNKMTQGEAWLKTVSMVPIGKIGGAAYNGLSTGLKSTIRQGVRNNSIINIRSNLLNNGFKQGVTRNGKGYLFTNPAGEKIRVMFRNGGWDIRMQNSFGNYLDEFGNVSGAQDSHGILLFSK